MKSNLLPEEETDLLNLLSKGASLPSQSNSCRIDVGEQSYLCRAVLLIESLVLIKMTNEGTGEKSADEGTQLNTLLFANKIVKPNEKFKFIFNPSNCGIVGQFSSGHDMKSNSYFNPFQNPNEDGAISNAVTPRVDIRQNDKYTNVLTKLNNEEAKSESINYAEGIAVMRLVDTNKIVEIFHDEENSEEDPEKKGLKINHSRREKVREEELAALENASIQSRFRELQDKANMKKAIGQLGKSHYFAYKLTSISAMLLINVVVGILFYLLISSLFDDLKFNLQLFQNLTITATNLIQTSYFSMEKILWQEGRLSFNPLEPNIKDIFSYLDSTSGALLTSVNDDILKISASVDGIGMENINAMWYTAPNFPLFKVGNATPSLLNFKEAFNSLLSSGLVHTSKPETHYTRTNTELQVFFENCQKSLYNQTLRFLDTQSQTQETQSDKKVLQLLGVLLGSVGLSLCFLVLAFFLYFNENKKKEELLGVFYSFDPNDIKSLISKNEKLISMVVIKDFYDNDAGFEMRNLLDAQEANDLPNENDNADFDQNQLIMISKRNKRRGKLDKLFDFNKCFMLFFALVNSLYFIFLYQYNVQLYTESYSLMKVARSNCELSLETNLRFTKAMNVLYQSRTADSLTFEEYNRDFKHFLNKRKELLLNLLNNKYSNADLFTQILDFFFKDSCKQTSVSTSLCSSLLQGSFLNGLLPTISKFISDLNMYNTYQLYLKEQENYINPSWMFRNGSDCDKNLFALQTYTSDDVWNCFPTSADFNETSK